MPATKKAAERLSALGLELPTPAAAMANYLPFLVEDGWIYVSGQLPVRDGQIACAGLVGSDVSLADAQQAARLCALNALGQLAVATGGDLDSIRIVRLGGFVASAPGFTEQSQVVNGASDLMVEVLGERGRHARAAVGVSALPRNAAVELEVVARFQA